MIKTPILQCITLVIKQLSRCTQYSNILHLYITDWSKDITLHPIIGKSRLYPDDEFFKAPHYYQDEELYSTIY